MADPASSCAVICVHDGTKGVNHPPQTTAHNKSCVQGCIQTHIGSYHFQSAFQTHVRQDTNRNKRFKRGFFYVGASSFDARGGYVQFCSKPRGRAQNGTQYLITKGSACITSSKHWTGTLCPFLPLEYVVVTRGWSPLRPPRWMSPCSSGDAYTAVQKEPDLSSRKERSKAAGDKSPGSAEFGSNAHDPHTAAAEMLVDRCPFLRKPSSCSFPACLPASARMHRCISRPGAQGRCGRCLPGSGAVFDWVGLIRSCRHTCARRMLMCGGPSGGRCGVWPNSGGPGRRVQPVWRVADAPVASTVAS